MSKSEIEFSAENAQKLGNLISRSTLIKTIHKHHYRLSNAINTTDYGMFTVGIEQAINEAPAVDAVSREVVEQIMWERDTAMEQLKEHGIPFGGVAPDVVKVCRCKDCKYYESTHYGHMCKCWEDWLPTEDDDFCSYGERRADE